MTLSLWQRVRVAMRDRDPKALAELEQELGAAKPPVPAPVQNALEAQFLMANGDEAGARRKLIGASKTRPLDPHEKLILGMLLIEDAPKARKLFGAAAKARLRDPRIPEGLGTTMVDMGEVEEGIKMLTRAVKDEPKSYSARFALGMAHVAAGKPAKAREDFEAVVKMRPDYEPAWLGYAAQSIAVGKAAEASRVLGPFVKLVPGRDKVLLAYVDCLLHAGDLPKALAAFTPLANASREPALLFDYVELCLQGEFLEPAEQTLAKIEKIDPKQPRLWLLRGQICELQPTKDVPGAMKAYEKAIAMDKGFIRALNALGLLLMRDTEHKDFGRAGKLLSTAAKSKEPAGVVALSNLALLALTQGKNADAHKFAKAALDRKIGPPAARAQAEKILAETAG